MPTRLRAVAFAALAVAGCGRDDPAAVPPPTAADAPYAAAVATPSTSSTIPAPPEPAATTAALANGRHAVYVKSVDVGSRTMVVDVIEFLTGEAARRASMDDGKGADVANDYYIRNVNPLLRTVTVAPTASVLVLDTVDPARSVTADVTAVATLVASGTPHPYWLTLAGGQVVKVEQQYLP